MGKLKIAIVGVGSISSLHIKSYLANRDVELYAFCDINEVRLQYMGERYGVTRLYTDEAEMLRALPELDAVSVCTWNSAHAACSIMALEAGKHVLCEKPMAMSVAEAEAMAEAAERNGKLLMIGFVRRFGRDCEAVKTLIDGGRLGEVYYAKAINLRRNGAPGGWFGDKSRSGGGPLIDLGVHSIDLVRYLLGNPRVKSVYSATFSKLGNRNNIKSPKAYVSSDRVKADVFNCEDLATAMVRFENDAVLSVEMSFSLNGESGDNTIQLYGTESGVKMGDDRLHLYGDMEGYLSDVTFEKHTALDVEQAFRAEINSFVDCIENGTPCRNPARDGVEMMRILCGIYESAESGNEVKF